MTLPHAHAHAHNPLIKINVVGPSGAGKTTISRKLEKFFKDEGCNVAVKDDDVVVNKANLDLSDRHVLIEITNSFRNNIDKPEQIEMKDGRGNITYGYFGNGIFVRHSDDDSPSIECVGGRKEWYKHGRLHRENGPAIKYDVVEMYFINGINVSDEIKEWLYERNIDYYEHMSEEDKLALRFFMRSLVQV